MQRVFGSSRQHWILPPLYNSVKWGSNARRSYSGFYIYIYIYIYKYKYKYNESRIYLTVTSCGRYLTSPRCATAKTMTRCFIGPQSERALDLRATSSEFAPIPTAEPNRYWTVLALQPRAAVSMHCTINHLYRLRHVN